MDKRALDAARREYAQAAEAVSTIRTSPDFRAIQSAWRLFLFAHRRVFLKLKEGSKSSGNAWWGRKVHERRKDALLRYLSHARNAAEHTIEEITSQHETRTRSTELNARLVGMMERGLIGRPNAPILQTVEIAVTNVRLLDVVDNNELYEVPKDHLGVPLTDPSPSTVAVLGLAYLESMLEEASKLTAD